MTVTGPNTATTGPVSYSVVVTGGGSTPTGSVSVSDGTGICAIATLDGTGSGSCSIVENAADSPFTVTAAYSGDGNYAGGTGTTTEVVRLGTPTMVLTGQSTGADTVDYIVTVSGPPGAAVPTGSVTVSDSNGFFCSTSPLDGTGRGSCSITDDDSGSPFTVNANYPADQNYTAATAVPTPSVTVTDDSSGEVTGDSLKFTAAVSGPGSGSVSPTGTVSWLVTGPGSPTCSDSTLSSGVATCTISHVVPGAYAAPASYSGDGNYSGSSGSDTTATVGPAPLTVTASERVHDLRRQPAGHHRQLFGIRKRRQRDRPHHPADVLDHGQKLEPGGQLRLVLLGSRRPLIIRSATSRFRVGDQGVPLVTASERPFAYGGTPPTITASYSGFVNGNNATDLTTQPTCSTTATSSSPVGGSLRLFLLRGGRPGLHDQLHQTGRVGESKAPP